MEKGGGVAFPKQRKNHISCGHLEGIYAYGVSMLAKTAEAALYDSVVFMMFHANVILRNKHSLDATSSNHLS